MLRVGRVHPCAARYTPHGYAVDAAPKRPHRGVPRWRLLNGANRVFLAPQWPVHTCQVTHS